MKVRVNQGFTIIELMMTVFIMGVLVVIAAPSFTSFLSGNALNADVRAFVGGISTAKAEAISRAQNVTFRPRGGADWRNGWEVVDSANAVIQQGKDLDNSYVFTMENGSSNFVFNSRGFMTPTAGDKLTVKDGNGNSIELTVTGTGVVVVK